MIICGAGAVGSCIAYFLTNKGIRPTVIERTGVACAASGKAGGFLALNWCDRTEVGPLARKSFELHAEMAKAIEIDYGYRKLDTLSIKLREKNVDASTKKSKQEKTPSWVDGNVIGFSTLGTTSTTAQVHPRKFTEAVMNSAMKAGATLKIGCVEGVKIEGNKVVGVIVDGKLHEAEVVVIAMGPWSEQARKWLPIPKIAALKAHSITLKPKEVLTPHALFLDFETDKGEHFEPEVYPRPDGEVYICGMAENVNLPDPASVQPTEGACQKIRKISESLSSTLVGAELGVEQACFLPIPPGNCPIIGKVPGVEGAYVATGHSCWGILNSPATGAAMAELIVDGKATCIDLSPFDPKHFVD